MNYFRGKNLRPKIKKSFSTLQIPTGLLPWFQQNPPMMPSPIFKCSSSDFTDFFLSWWKITDSWVLHKKRMAIMVRAWLLGNVICAGGRRQDEVIVCQDFLTIFKWNQNQQLEHCFKSPLKTNLNLNDGLESFCGKLFVSAGTWPRKSWTSWKVTF